MHTDGGSGASEAAARELSSPAVTPERLAEIAAAHPELHARVAAHPRAYPDLVAWIAARSAVPQPAARSAVPQPAAAPSAPAQGAQPAPTPAKPPRRKPAKPAPTAAPAVRTAAGALPAAEGPARPASAGTTRALFSGIGIGVLIGAALSSVLVIWVLPGLFGSVLG